MNGATHSIEWRGAALGGAAVVADEVETVGAAVAVGVGVEPGVGVATGLGRAAGAAVAVGVGVGVGLGVGLAAGVLGVDRTVGVGVGAGLGRGRMGMGEAVGDGVGVGSGRGIGSVDRGAMVKLSSPGMVCGAAVLFCVLCAIAGAVLANNAITARRSGERHIWEGRFLVIVSIG